MWTRLKKLTLSGVFLAGVIVFIIGLIPVMIGCGIISNVEQVVSVYAIDDTLIVQSDMDIATMKRCMEYYSFTGIDQNATFTSSNRWADNVTVQYVDGHYEKVIEPNVKKGRWLMLGDASMNCAVIDEGLANQLYGQTDCIGETFEYMDKTYTIIALCDAPSIFTSREKYIAYLMYTNGSPVDYVGIIGKPISYVYTDKALSTMGSELLSYHTIYNMKILSQKAWYQARFLLLPPVMLLLIFAYRWLKKWIIKRIETIKEKLKNQYTRVLLPEIILSVLGGLVMSGVWVVVLWGLYTIMTKNLVYLDQYMPVSTVDLKAVKQMAQEIIYKLNNNNQVYYPPEVLKVIWGQRLIGLSAAFFYTGGILMLAGLRKQRKDKKKKSYK